MIQKTIQYKTFTGETITEDFNFHLSKADLIDLEIEVPGGLENYITKIVNARDPKSIIDILKLLINRSYGVITDDGKGFEKKQELLDKFKSTNAYSELYMSLLSDADAASEFIQGIMPEVDEASSEKIKEEAQKRMDEFKQTGRITTPRING